MSTIIGGVFLLSFFSALIGVLEQLCRPKRKGRNRA